MNKGKDMILINEELNATIYETEEIKRLIYTIRGRQVMLDSDVAMLYQYETKKINQTVKRNIKRFPENFCFQLTENELECLRSQIVTLERNNRKLEVAICDLKGNENRKCKDRNCNFKQK